MKWEYSICLAYGMETTSWSLSSMMVLCGYIPVRLIVFNNDN